VRVLFARLTRALRTCRRDLPSPPTHALTSCRPTRSVSIIAWRGACAGHFSAVSIPSPTTVQDSRRPTRCAGGPRCTQGQGLASGQQRRCPGLSIAGRSVTERARPTRGQHALHRKATPRFPALVSAQKRFLGRALSRPWCARAERTRREARRSCLRMPTIASPHPPNAEQEQEACAERNQAGGLGNADDGDNPIFSSRAVGSPNSPGSEWLP
jgi:hypothetical protein